MKHRIMIFIILILLLTTGCKANIGKNEIGEDYEDNTVTAAVEKDAIVERSEIISDTIVELFGIDDATTVIFNNSALVGVKTAYDQELTQDTKEIIESKVLNIDSDISEVLITNKERVFTEIDNIVIELLQGKSYDDLVDNISKIKGKFN